MVFQNNKQDPAIFTSDYTTRYLWGPAVDQLLGMQAVQLDSSNFVVTDQQNTVRGNYTGSGSLLEAKFDAFGHALVFYGDQGQFAYTARYYDLFDSLHWNGTR